MAHATGSPSPWVQRWLHLLPAGGTVLDVGCGSGRHLRWLAEQGFRLTGVDRDELAVAPLRALAEVIVADIEGGPWPLAGRRFDTVLVTNYLWRPLLPVMVDSVSPGGVLLYETFADGQQTVGRPSRSDFLLQPGDLLAACAGLHVVAYEHGFLHGPERYVQRIVALRSPPAHARHALDGPPGAGS